MKEQIEEMERIVGSCESIPDEICVKHKSCARCKAERVFNADYRKKSEVAREIFEEIENKINNDLKNDKKVLPQFEISNVLWRNRVSGRINAFQRVLEYIAELKKKYTEDQT
ncbi:MAG: hypothetical protein IIX86_05370 [Clostridia bacterium]|nr:hypothetical protein [Clostridia bacterium]